MPSIYYYCLCNSPIVLVSNPPLEGYVLLTLSPFPGRSFCAWDRPTVQKIAKFFVKIGIGPSTRHTTNQFVVWRVGRVMSSQKGPEVPPPTIDQKTSKQ